MPSPSQLLARPKRRLGDVTSTLHDFSITSYDVPLDRLQSYLPTGFEAEPFDLKDGRTRGLVSAVSFLNTNFYVTFAPFVRLRAYQTNYRAYIRYGETRCVWFFGTSLGSRFVFLPRYAWKLPWHYAKTTHQTEWRDNRCMKLVWHAQLGNEQEVLHAQGPGQDVDVLDGFVDHERTVEILTHPLQGYLRRRDGRIATYGVWHERLVMQQVQVQSARHTLFERLELVEPEQRPHSCLVQRSTDFLVRLPPQRVGK